MATFNAGDIQATASLDRTPFMRDLDAAIREGRAFEKMTFTAKADLDYSQVDRKLALSKAKLQQFSGTKYTAKLDADRSSLARGLQSAEAELRRLGGGKDLKFNADLDASPVLRKLDEIAQASNRTADSIGSGFTSSFQKIKFGAIFAGITLGAAGATPAIVGLAAAFGIAGMAASGISKALQAYSAQQKAIEKGTGASTASTLSNARAIRDAQQGIADARKNQARVAEDSGERIAAADRDVVEAERDVQAATKKTADARKDATRALEDAIDKQAGYALSQEAAIVAIMRAEEERQKVFMDGASTDLDKREAELNLNEAISRQVGLQKQQNRDTEDFIDLQAKGVEGSDQVLAAKEAERNAANRLADAQLAQSKANRDAGRAQEDAAIQVAKAVQNLQDAQASQAAAAADAAEKTDQFAEAMAKISPAGQLVVKQLLDMKAGLDRLQNASEGAIAPGFVRALQGVQSLEPAVTKGIQAIGGALSDSADKAGELFATPLFQGELESALVNTAPLVETIGDSVVQLINDFVHFGATASPIIDGVDGLLQKTVDGLGGFFDEVGADAAAVGQTFDSFGTIIGDILRGLGVLTGDFASGWSSARSSIEPAIASLIAVFNDFSGGALSSFSDGFSVVLNVVKVFLDIIKPVAGVLGGIAGDVIAATLAFKLFAGPITKIIALFGSLSTANIASKLFAAAPAFATVGTSIDKTTGKITAAEGKTTTAFSKIAGGAIGAAKYVPLVGIAVAALSETFDAFVHDSDELADAMLKGGQAAADASKTLAEYNDSTSIGNPLNKAFGASTDEVTKKMQDLRAAMTPVQRAQQDVTAAQNDLTYAQKTYGDQSVQAKTATSLLAYATRDLKDRQYEAEEATKSLTEKIRDQQDAAINAAGGQIAFERSTIRVRDAQRDLDEKRKSSTTTADELREAELQVEQAMLDSLTAATSLAAANSAGLLPSEAAANSAAYFNTQLMNLSATAGTSLPPKLQDMINKFSDADIKAAGASYKVDDLGNKIIQLPTPRPLDFPNNADVAATAMDKLRDSVKGVAGAYTTWMDNYIKLIRAMQNNPVPAADSGLSGFNFNEIQTRAVGGYFNPGQPTLVGEQGPELVFPSRRAFVATSVQSRAIKAGVEAGAARAGGMNSVAAADGTTAVVDEFRAIFAGGLRVKFDTGSLETGTILAQRRRDSR